MYSTKTPISKEAKKLFGINIDDFVSRANVTSFYSAVKKLRETGSPQFLDYTVMEKSFIGLLEFLPPDIIAIHSCEDNLGARLLLKEIMLNNVSQIRETGVIKTEKKKKKTKQKTGGYSYPYNILQLSKNGMIKYAKYPNQCIQGSIPKHANLFECAHGNYKQLLRDQFRYIIKNKCGVDTEFECVFNGIRRHQKGHLFYHNGSIRLVIIDIQEKREEKTG